MVVTNGLPVNNFTSRGYLAENDPKLKYREAADRRRRSRVRDIFPVLILRKDREITPGFETEEENIDSKLGDDYKSKELFDDAINSYTDSLRSHLKKKADSPQIQILLGKIGNAYFSNEEETTALAHFLVSHRMFIESYSEFGNLLCTKQKKVISTLDSALSSRPKRNTSMTDQKIFSVADKVVQIEKSIGNIHVEYGRSEIAHKFYQNAYRVELADKGPHSSETADLLVDIGKLYNSEGKHDEALQNLEQALSIYADQEDSQIKVSNTLKQIGHICFENLKKYDMALSLYRQASRVMIDSVIEDSNSFKHQLEIAEIQLCIGTIHMFLENFLKAKENMDKAFSIYCYILGDDHEKVGHSYIRLGVLRMKMNKMKEASDAFKNALSILRHKGFRSQHPLIIEIKKNLKRAEFFLKY